MSGERRDVTSLLGVVAAAVSLTATRALVRARRRFHLRDRVVLITGGSRGLGLALAHAFADRGARLVICARDEHELSSARDELERRGAEVLAIACDVSDRADVIRLVEAATDRFGRIDVVVNNAGIMTVGPVESQTVADFERAMAVMYWGVLYPTLAVLPQMRQRGEGRIVTITSIGGKLSAPHLVPYSAAKYAAVGFSEGLRAELSGTGIAVVTVVPWFMRTGSMVNADFKGHNRKEFAWFTLAGNLPVSSISAAHAARAIVRATERGDPEIIVSPQAKLAVRFVGLFPGTTARLLGVVNRLLPKGTDPEPHRGAESASALTRSPLTALGRRAAKRYHQYAVPESNAGKPNGSH